MKNKMRIIVPAVIVLIGILGYSIAATNLQTWQTQAGSKVAAIDSNGSLNLNTATTTTLTASSGTAGNLTGGTLTISQPFNGTGYKQVIIGATGISTSAATTFTWPTAFTQTPSVIGTTMVSSGTATGSTVNPGLTLTSGTGGTLTASTTGGTLVITTSGSAGASGVIVVQGY